MRYTNISKANFNEKSVFCGFVKEIRNKNNIAFIVLQDITGTIQLTFLKKDHPEFEQLLSRITAESCIFVEGIVKENPSVKLNGKEMVVDKLTIETIATSPLPIDDTSLLDTRLNYRWLDLRTQKNQLMFKVQSYLVNVMREFLVQKDFIEIHSPKLIATASESGSDVFKVDYFDTNAYLAQSPQFYKQMAIASGLERIFETGPVFRAEKSHTNKHATEFSGFDLEFTNINGVEDVMNMEAELLRYAIKKTKEKYGEEIKNVFGIDLVVPTLPFPIIKLNDLYDVLASKYNYIVPEEEKGDLPTEGEKLCLHLAKEKYNHEFLFVTDFSKEKRAFYHKRIDNVPQGYDLIWKGCEITTGAVRENKYDILKQQCDEKGLTKDVEFYLEFFKYGCAPHGGFGIGIDRLTMLIFNLTVKEAQFIFRGTNRLKP